MVVERKWSTNDTSKLEVRSKDGARFPSPQAMLDKLVGRLSFDPLIFLRQDPKQQAEALRSLSGVDFTLLDKKRGDSFAQRTVVNRDVAALESRYAAMPKGLQGEPIAVADLLKKQAVALEANRRLAEAQETAGRMRHQVERAREELKRAEQTLAAAKDLLAHNEKAAAEAGEKATDLEFETGAISPSLSEVNEALSALEATNRERRAWAEKEEARLRLEEKKNDAEALTKEIEGIDANKEMILAGANLPLEGLAFDERGVTFKGLPLEQASGAERLRVSVAIGLALNPKLKVLLVRDGSLLDSASLQVLSDMAEKAGAQVWIEVVGEDGVGVVIEDGEVKQPAAAKKAKAAK